VIFFEQVFSSGNGQSECLSEYPLFWLRVFLGFSFPPVLRWDSTLNSITDATVSIRFNALSFSYALFYNLPFWQRCYIPNWTLIRCWLYEMLSFHSCNLKITDWWGVAPCSLVEIYQNFGRISCCHLQGGRKFSGTTRFRFPGNQSSLQWLFILWYTGLWHRVVCGGYQRFGGTYYFHL
jgi:hypothetical protein